MRPTRTRNVRGLPCTSLLYLSALEVEQLRAVSRVVKEPMAWRMRVERSTSIAICPPHSVAAITLEFRNHNDARIVAR